MTGWTVRPAPGNGVLARLGDVVLLFGAQPDDAVQQLLELLETVDAEGGDGRRLGRRLAGLLSSLDDAPPLVAFGPTGDQVAVLVHGDAMLVANTAGGEVRLDGSQAMTWVDRVISDATSISASLGKGAAGASTRFRLDDGVVPADGFVMQPGGGRPRRTPAPATPAAPPPPPPPEPVITPSAGPAQAVATSGAVAASSFVDEEPVRDFTAAPPSDDFSTPPVQDFTSPPPADDFSSPMPAAATPAPPPPPPPPPPTPAPAPAPAPAEPAAPMDEPVAAVPLDAPATPMPDMPTPPAEPGPAAGVDRSEPFESVLLAGPEASLNDTPLAPLPVGEEAAEEEEEVHPEVLGIYCKNDHFNDPRAPYCGVCGISMVQLTHIARPGPRPPLGVLVLDDGATFRLDTSYVIGREPERNQEVAEGRARSVRLYDPEGLVSRAHAMIELVDWDVKVNDLGSANGTYVFPPGADGWIRVLPNAPITITPGTRVGLGRRGFLYESHRKSPVFEAGTAPR
ncbi:FHA domain-containing protein [Fodinicola acaciae]|uniref:FHA domain-containing protein n=1 Tax=Fodinicola acaciae TaxID=2681555 RepID=UPI0013D48B55|nr:FHA domain-containing protein [Fodinicola acaciae]